MASSRVPACTVAPAAEAQLEAEITELQATRDGWQKGGMLGKADHCSADGRPCIQVDERGWGVRGA
ncbi:hypothetical protein [Lichenicoccus sp.]|uniref:hypothetical protein n=1 Tax=Lichenicoccus sp. TaxID=2781899 RepID=UPI003D09B8C6